MNQKILFGLLVFILSCQLCSAQAPQAPPLGSMTWSVNSNAALSQPLFPGEPEWKVSGLNDSPVDREWQIAELVCDLSGIRSGTRLETAVWKIRMLGGIPDGGLQSVPPTFFYLDPGLTIEIPVKDGRVNGPLHLSQVPQNPPCGCYD
jgi:hypothetical protein